MVKVTYVSSKPSDSQTSNGFVQRSNAASEKACAWQVDETAPACGAARRRRARA